MIGSLKRLLSLALVIAMLGCSFTSVGFAEDVSPIPQGVSDIIIPNVEDNTPHKINFHLEGKDITDQIENEIELDSSGFSDMSLQVAGITATVIPAANTFAVGDNTPPVAGLYPVVLNEETLKNGFPTVLTQIAFFWQVGDTALTYDPDGDAIANVFVGGVTNETIKAVTADGFAVQFSAPGTYNLLYQVQDIRGAYSNLVQYEITVVSIDNINTFKGQLDSTGSEQTFETTIQLSDIGSDTMVLGLVEYDMQAVTATLLDSTGAKVAEAKNTYVYDENSYAISVGKRRVTFPTPQSDTGTVTYTIKVSGKPYSKFEVAIGGSNTTGDMLGGIDHAVPALINVINQKNYSFKASNSLNYSPNTYEDYYKFYTNSITTTITLNGGNDAKNLYFKVFEQDTLALRYDSYEDVESVKQAPSGVVNRAHLKLPPGDYYAVVYTPEALRTSSEPTTGTGYNIYIGDPVLVLGFYDAVGYPHSYTANKMTFDNIDTSFLPESAMMQNINITKHSGDSVRASDFRSTDARIAWKGNWQPWIISGPYSITISSFPYGYLGEGTLQVGITLGKSVSTLTNAYSIRCYYHMGDYNT